LFPNVHHALIIDICREAARKKKVWSQAIMLQDDSRLFLLEDPVNPGGKPGLGPRLMSE
jgi:hypothetical protein